MRFAVCDGSKEFRKCLMFELKQYCSDVESDEFSSEQGLLESYLPQKYNAVFISAETHGLQTACKIREADPDVEIVLCTSKDMLSTHGYEIGSCEIFSKNSSYEYYKQKLTAIYQKCCICNYIFQYQQVSIKASNILYFHRKPFCIIMKTNTESVSLRAKLSHINISGFIRISSDYYVNPIHILFYGKDFVLLDNMERLHYNKSCNKRI